MRKRKILPLIKSSPFERKTLLEWKKYLESRKKSHLHPDEIEDIQEVRPKARQEIISRSISRPPVNVEPVKVPPSPKEEVVSKPIEKAPISPTKPLPTNPPKQLPQTVQNTPQALPVPKPAKGDVEVTPRIVDSRIQAKDKNGNPVIDKATGKPKSFRVSYNEVTLNGDFAFVKAYRIRRMVRNGEVKYIVAVLPKPKKKDQFQQLQLTPESEPDWKQEASYNEKEFLEWVNRIGWGRELFDELVFPTETPFKLSGKGERTYAGNVKPAKDVDLIGSRSRVGTQDNLRHSLEDTSNQEDKYSRVPKIRLKKPIQEDDE
jgi:hypothetical protein